jgi:Arc/MetJ-type ribon-helix-helix transcriptional regulator
MHVHAEHPGSVRTTVEITDQQRARLLEIAASRGQKGFSSLVQEAIELLLEREASRGGRVRAALSVLGSLSDEQADAMLAVASESRNRWR